MRPLALGGYPADVAVNLSVRNLLDAELPRDVAALLARSGLRADGARARDHRERADRRPGPLAERSCAGSAPPASGIAIDDYGTGYSSLAYIRRMPVDELKIDKSFVIGMATDDNDAVIVRSTIELARNLGLRVVAEGVETEGAWHRLATLGCDVAQGYYLGRPVPADTFFASLAKGHGFLKRPAHTNVEDTSARPAMRLLPTPTPRAAGDRSG